jgi:carotenoid phi-ring synthase / carotenoid chi-ring synthase
MIIWRRETHWQPGRDPRAVRHLAPRGAARLADESRPVVVAGGGIAGIAAAVGLAERGVPVIMVEPHEQLGGRVRSWSVMHGDDQVTMSRGFHAFFRQYYNLRALIRRIDPDLQSLVAVADYPLILADGHADSFASIPRTPPLNIAAFVLQSPSFRLRDLAAVNVPAALELLDVEFPNTYSRYDGESAAEFLDRLRFPEAARHLALEVFARSFFAHPDDFSAGELVAMFHTYFLGSSEGLLFDVPRDDYDSCLWSPLRRYLERLGAEVRTSESVTWIDASQDVPRIGLASGTEIAADALVLATDPATLRRLALESELGDETWRERIAATGHAPPFAVWRLWLDRLVAPERAAFLGTSGFGPLDNISVLERFEEGARRWATACGGSVVELHAYALPAQPDEAALKGRLMAELRRIYPELEQATVVAEEWLVNNDCPLWGTDPWEQRPTVRTPHPRIVLAGDSIRCDFPGALMERAATTGFLAANQLLNIYGVAGHDLWTVPMRSRHQVAVCFSACSSLAERGGWLVAMRPSRIRLLQARISGLAPARRGRASRSSRRGSWFNLRSRFGSIRWTDTSRTIPWARAWAGKPRSRARDPRRPSNVDLAQALNRWRSVVMLGAVRRKRRGLPLAVLAILIAVNAVLIALLLRSQSQVTAQPAGQLTIGSTLPTQEPARSPAQGESPSPNLSPSSAPPKVALPTRLLVATSATKAWRATVGDCRTPGRVERSDNAGKSWRQAEMATLGPIVRLGTESNGNLYAVGGAGEDCSIRYISYSAAGEIAAQTDKPRGVWFRDPKDPDEIYGPGSARAMPCNGQHVVGLASLSTTVALLVCTDGSVMVSSNSGKSWKKADELVGTMAVGAGDGRFWVAGEDGSCDGIAIRSFSLAAGKLSRGPIRCAATLPRAPGRIAIDVSGKEIWLWAGNKVQVSTDRGRTWKAA